MFSPGELFGQSSLVGYSPWGRKESDTTEQLTLHFSVLQLGLGWGTGSGALESQSQVTF